MTFPFTLTDDPRWCLEIVGFDPMTEAAIEAVLALSNGYAGVRSALEEGHASARPATFLAGVFNTPAQPQAPELEAPVPELVVAPDWSRLRVVAEGQELGLDYVELLDMRRTLDMRQGVLLRTWRVRDGAGRITALRSLRCVSLADRQACAYALTISPENYSGYVELTTTVDGQVHNENKTLHLAPLSAGPIASGGLLHMRSLQSGYELAYAAHAELAGVAPGALESELSFSAAGAFSQRFAWQATQGQSYTLTKLVALATSREQSAPAAHVTTHCAALAAAGLAPLLDAHRAAWAERWANADIAIAGDAEIQRQVRFAIYQLIGAASPADEHASVGARALTGERYRGHVFWDNEIFAWPFYLYTHPPTARALLMYRYHTLSGARAKAAEMGYAGAMYPWEAADSGVEVTPAFMISGGIRVPVLTGIEEHHISADIAYAVGQYSLISGDNDFLGLHGAEMLFDIARFWASRVRLGDDGAYHIDKVIGPDEYHESVDDNAYTNLLARWSLREALRVAERLRAVQPAPWQDLCAQLSLSPADLARWAEVAEGLATGYDPASGLIEQFRGYHGLEEIDLSDHDTNVATADARLGWYAMQRTKVLKQADVLMALILLWDEFTPAVRAANFRYYEPRTSHDSSLSPSFHALFAARLGELELAERYLRQAALIDLNFTRKGHAGASGGVHIAALGGIWQALVFGFLGLRTEGERLHVEPHIPPSWGQVSTTIHWRGRRLRISAEPNGAWEIAG